MSTARAGDLVTVITQCQYTCKLFHPVTLASAHMVVDDTKDVANQVARMLRNNRAEDWALWVALRAPATPV